MKPSQLSRSARPSPAPPSASAAGGEPASYSAVELAAAAGVTVRAIRFYVAERLLEAPPFRGSSTRYGREHLLRLRAIAWLQKEEHLRLPDIRRRLSRMSVADLERLLPPAPDPPPAASAPARGPTDGLPWRAEAARPRESWTRVVLCPGVELHVRADADTEAERVAREIVLRYAVP